LRKKSYASNAIKQRKQKQINATQTLALKNYASNANNTRKLRKQKVNKRNASTANGALTQEQSRLYFSRK